MIAVTTSVRSHVNGYSTEPERYKGHASIIDRVFDGTIGPELEDFYTYMGQSPAERGTDGYDYQWVDGYNVDEDVIDEKWPLPVS